MWPSTCLVVFLLLQVVRAWQSSTFVSHVSCTSNQLLIAFNRADPSIRAHLDADDGATVEALGAMDGQECPPRELHPNQPLELLMYISDKPVGSGCWVTNLAYGPDSTRAYVQATVSLLDSRQMVEKSALVHCHPNKTTTEGLSLPAPAHAGLTMQLYQFNKPTKSLAVGTAAKINVTLRDGSFTAMHPHFCTLEYLEGPDEKEQHHHSMTFLADGCPIPDSSLHPFISNYSRLSDVTTVMQFTAWDIRHASEEHAKLPENSHLTVRCRVKLCAERSDCILACATSNPTVTTQSTTTPVVPTDPFNTTIERDRRQTGLVEFEHVSVTVRLHEPGAKEGSTCVPAGMAQNVVTLVAVLLILLLSAVLLIICLCATLRKYRLYAGQGNLGTVHWGGREHVYYDTTRSMAAAPAAYRPEISPPVTTTDTTTDSFAASA